MSYDLFVNLNDLRTLVDYNYWARDRMLTAIELLPAEMLTRDLGNSFRSIRDTAGHIFAAEFVWYQRWNGTSPPLPAADQFADVSALRAAWTLLERQTRALLDTLDDEGILRLIEYRLASGAAGASRFCDMVQHVVNHGTYHRGQVTTMLRQLGAAPPQSTDMITYQRVVSQSSGLRA
jgi:uncharacterized damage-inducible protein DinB